MTKVLAIGDVMGKAGRLALERLLPRARADLKPDFVLCNGENAAGGFGLTAKVYEFLTGSLGIDCVTMGNHWHDKREIHDFLPKVDRVVLPANMANVEREQAGLCLLRAKSGAEIAVVNLIGRAFMHGDNRDPFKAADRLLALVPSTVKLRIVDMHAEATSEKQGMGWHLCGRASLVYGTHSHVPTADERLLKSGMNSTGFVTDIGMTGGYGSVIGIRREAAIHRLLTGEKKKFEPATDDPWFCFIVADLDDQTGQCRSIQRYRWSLAEMGELAQVPDPS